MNAKERAEWRDYLAQGHPVNPNAVTALLEHIDEMERALRGAEPALERVWKMTPGGSSKSIALARLKLVRKLLGTEEQR
jgi:hypothetical protein